MAADGDRERFEQAYIAHFESVLRYCVRRTSQDQALEAAAETFAVAWRRRHDLPWERPLPWLYGVAGKVLAVQRRGWSRQLRLVDRLRAARAARPVDPALVVVQRAEEEAVSAALRRLNSVDQELIRLAAWERLSRDELAIALECSPNTASKRLGRALGRLASELGATRMVGARFFKGERSRS